MARSWVFGRKGVYVCILIGHTIMVSALYCYRWFSIQAGINPKPNILYFTYMRIQNSKESIQHITDVVSSLYKSRGVQVQTTAMESRVNQRKMQDVVNS